MRKERPEHTRYGISRPERKWWTHMIFIPDSLTDPMPTGNFSGCCFVISPYLDWNQESLMDSDDVFLDGPVFYFPAVSPLSVLAYGLDWNEEEQKS
jgi:hypothetical protein